MTEEREGHEPNKKQDPRGFQLSPNRSQEIQTMLKGLDYIDTRKKATSSKEIRALKWFLYQIRNLVERENEERVG